MRLFRTAALLLLISISATGLVNLGHASQQNLTETEAFIPFDDASIADIAALASQKRAVLLGESTHGTSEYYQVRAEISKELIREHGFNFIVVEGDWDAAWEVNKFVKNLEGAPDSAEEALTHFTRWPEWMWNNEEVLELVVWLREWNDALGDESAKAGFYGMDVYGFMDSVHFLREESDNLSGEARNAVRIAAHCMNRFGGNQRAYLEHVARTNEHCGRDINEAIDAVGQLERPDSYSELEWFNLAQHLRVVRQADLHLRGMMQQGPFSWNERASNFKNTLTHLLDFYGGNARGIAWAHNTHIGDARATDMANAGMHNIGQLTRTAYGQENVFALGFGTYEGSVKVGFEWEGRMQLVDMPPAMEGSLEAQLYEANTSPFWFNLQDEQTRQLFPERIPHRAIGVVYNPESESRQNYVDTDLPARYDAFVFIPTTRALSPLFE